MMDLTYFFTHILTKNVLQNNFLRRSLTGLRMNIERVGTSEKELPREITFIYFCGSIKFKRPKRQEAR